VNITLSSHKKKRSSLAYHTIQEFFSIFHVLRTLCRIQARFFSISPLQTRLIFTKAKVRVFFLNRGSEVEITDSPSLVISRLQQKSFVEVKISILSQC